MNVVCGRGVLLLLLRLRLRFRRSKLVVKTMESDVRPTEASLSAAGEYKVYVTNGNVVLSHVIWKIAML